MMSDSQEQVRNLFNLNKEEKILDDFGCTLSETIPILGRLYLTEHYICFGSNLFGFNRKYSIPFNEITILSLKKTNIEIESKNNKKNKFVFSSFTDVKIVYKRIKSMCRSYNDNITISCFEKKNKEGIIPIILSDSEDSDDESEEIITNKTSASSKKENSNSNSSNENSPKANNTETNIIIDKSMNNIINNNSNQNLIKSNTINEQSINKLNLAESIKNEEINTNLNSNSNNNSSVKRKKSSNSIKSKKSEDVRNKIHFLNKNDIIEEEEIKFNPIDEDLDYEICRKIININPKNFFEKYLTSAYPETSYQKYYEWVGDYTEINVQDWEKIENPENPEIEKFKKIETYCLALRGVPLINKSNVNKTLYYWKDKDGTYYIKTSSRSQGVPLSDCFLVETTLEFHPYMNNTKTVFRTYVRTVMLKSTLFKSTLISQGKKSYNQEVTKWLQFIEEKGDKIEGDYVYKPKKRRNSFGDIHKSLGHGVEKEISQMKNSKHIVTFSDFCEDIYNGTRKYAKLSYDYFYREFDKKTRTILICFLVVFILLLYIIQGQNNEIKELKKGINDMKSTLDNLTNMVLELKKNMEK